MCAKSYGDTVRCSDCPYDALTPRACFEPSCQDDLYKDALNLITEQEKEIERLKAKITNIKTDFDSLYKDYEFVRDCDAEHRLEINETVKQAKIDVLTELKRIMTAYSWQIDINDVKKEIDKIIEEVEK